MKAFKLVIAFLLSATVGMGSAWADRGGHGGHFEHHHFGHDRFGVVVGPGWGPWYDPWFYDPPAVIETPAPQAYVQQPTPSASAWYYCAESRSYYPYVKKCPGGWQPVAPQPPAQP